MTLSTLAELVNLRSRPEIKGNIISYPRYWQVPAATERAAFEAMIESKAVQNFTYIGFPWATMIDGLRRDTKTNHETLLALRNINNCNNFKNDLKSVTVAQHIHADKFIDVFRTCGITDLFWSHSQSHQLRLGGINIHPFPLYPAQTSGDPEHSNLHRPRRYLANFIGTYNPKVYLTDVRDHIFRDAGKADDLLIIRREDWHFERIVYTEQLMGLKPSAATTNIEKSQKEEYLNAIRQSTFTLCPTGSGPNSIRIAEALALASIPIILTNRLALPGDNELWRKACVFEEDSLDGYRNAIHRARSMSLEEVSLRQKACCDLFSQIKPSSYASIITSVISNQQKN